MQKFMTIAKPILGEKKKNNAKFSGHYVRQRMQNVRAQALRSYQQYD